MATHRYTITFRAFTTSPREEIDSVVIEVPTDRRIEDENQTALVNQAWAALYTYLAEHPTNVQPSRTDAHWELEANLENWHEVKSGAW